MARIKKVACSGCGKMIDTDDRYCGYCRGKNGQFEAKSKKRVDVATEHNGRIFRGFFLILLVAGIVAAIVFLL